MRAVVQRVSRAAVRVDGRTVGSIDGGVLVLIGIAEADAPADASWLADKIRNLRIFPDERGAMNRSLDDTGGAVLLVSQFTLLGDARKGRRPSFVAAADPTPARALCESVAHYLREAGVPVAEGAFGAHMEVESVNDGPVTILLDSTKAF